MQCARAAQRVAIAATALCWAVAGLPLSARAQAGEASPPSTTQLQERVVTAIRVVDENGHVLQENPAGLAVAPGQPYDAAAVRESLKQLFRSGRFADVEAETSEVAGGLRLDFVVSENYYVNQVRVVGLKEPPSEATALSVMRLNLGEVFSETRLKEGLARLGQLLEDESFYEPIYNATTERKPETRQIDITVTVDPGPRARIGTLRVINQTPFPDRQLLEKAKLKKGREATSVRRARSGERLRNYLVKEGYLGSRVTVRRGAYDRESNTVALEVGASAGSRVRVEVTGASVSGENLRRLLPIYQEGAVDDDLLREGQRNLRAHFEREGFFDAAVEFTTREEEGTQIIEYRVARGDKRRLVGIEISGNRYFSDSLLLERMAIEPAAFLSPGRFNTRLLEDEVTSLTEVYRANGYQQVEVRSELVENYGGKPSDLFVRFHVEEGPQTLVSDLALEGNATLSTDFLSAYISSNPGQPYSEFNVRNDRNNILALYFDAGFPEAQVETEVAPAEVPDRMRVRYRISEGQQVRVERVLIDGYKYTQRDRIDREVTIAPKGPLRQGDVVETQRQLYELGIFNRVQAAPQNPEGADPTKTMVVLVEEAKRYTLAYGGGIEFQRLESRSDPGRNELRVSPRGLLEVTKNNVLGRAHTLSFKGRASTLQGRALVTYATPSFTGRKSLTLLASALYDRTRDVSTFSAERYEAGLQVAARHSAFTTVLYRYAFRRVVVDPTSLKIDPQEVPLFSQPTRISGPGVTWIHDRRDNPADATRGQFNTVDFSLAFKTLGSDASFARVLVQNSSFHRVGRSLVFARSVRFGVQEPFAATPTVEVPLPERFFAGGGYSLRGFGLNQAGPRDPVTGFPVGGLALLVFNNELRFPMPLPKLRQMGGALFYDAGNVFTRVSDISLRPEPSLSDIALGRLNYFSHTVGFSFRYPTPVGPVRLDLGYLLNPARFAVDDGMGGTTLDRLPRFQFFLSIGPNF